MVVGLKPDQTMSPMHNYYMHIQGWRQLPKSGGGGELIISLSSHTHT